MSTRAKGWVVAVSGALCALSLGACPDDSHGGGASGGGGGGAGQAGHGGASGSGGTGTAGAGSGSSALQWFATCGSPVCTTEPGPSDDPSIPNCTTEKMGDACTTEGAQCDGVLQCGASLRCTDRDPTAGPGGCPISRARFKDDIQYLDQGALQSYRDQITHLPLASYTYKHAKGAGPQLGFIIDDIEPSVAVAGDHVNMYGYLSMAVAAIQVQQRELDELRAELHALHEQCAP